MDKPLDCAGITGQVGKIDICELKIGDEITMNHDPSRWEKIKSIFGYKIPDKDVYIVKGIYPPIAIARKESSVKITYKNGEKVTKKLTRAECDEILADLDGHPHVEKVEIDEPTST